MIDESKIKPLDYLLNKLQENQDLNNSVPKCAMLIGAGCSRSSEIPTGWGVIERLRKLTFLDYTPNGKDYKINQFEIDESKFSKLHSSFQEFYISKESELRKSIEGELKGEYEFPEYLTKHINTTENFDAIENVFSDRLYGYWFQEYSEDPRERQRFIEHLIDKSEPSGSYILLSHIIASGRLSTIFTTNFDDLINDCLIKFTSTKPRVIAHNEISSYINPLSRRPSIIKLHGDFLFENIKNINEETQILGSNMVDKLNESVKNRLDIVVIGYSGSDNSIMDALVELKKKSPFGLYWCSNDQNNINWKAQALINEFPNSYFINVENFAMLTYYFYKRCESEIELPDYYDEAKQKDKNFSRFMHQLGEELEQTASITELEKEEIQRNFENIIDRNSFYKFHELENNTDKQQHLSTLMLLDKIKKAPLHIVASALSNLKTIDDEKTQRLGKRIPNEYIDRKMKDMLPGEARSTLGELISLNPDKLKDFKSLRDDKVDEVLQEPYSLRDFINYSKSVSTFSFNQLINKYKDSIVQKLDGANLNEVYLFLKEIRSDSPKQAYSIFADLNKEELIVKINKSDFDIISYTIALLSKIDKNRAYDMCQHLDIEKITETVKKLSLNNIVTGIHALSNNNSYLGHQILSNTSDEVFIDKIHSADISEIAESLHYLSLLKKNRFLTLIKKVPDTFFVENFNKSNLNYQQLGNVCNKLIKFNYTRFTKIIRDSDTGYLVKNVISSIRKTGDQVFLHFVKSIFKANKYLLAQIIESCPQEYINHILNSDKIHGYTVNLPFLKNALDMNNMNTEKLLVEKIIEDNQHLFRKKRLKNYNKEINRHNMRR